MEITKTAFPTLMLTIVMLTFGFLNKKLLPCEQG